MLPDFNSDGDLPPGIHLASLEEVRKRFGVGSMQRIAVAGRLDRIYELVKSTGQLARFIVFGSFVTAKEHPNDVDIVVIMNDSFDLQSLAGEAAIPFYHGQADAHF